jgi:hypothetical protein
MPVTSEIEVRELAQRSIDGIDVTLLKEPANELRVCRRRGRARGPVEK